MLDDHGQPIVKGFNQQRTLLRSVESLLGICKGLLADGVLSPEEIVFLDTWLKDNQEVATAWPGEMIAARVQQILADGIVTTDEAEDLKETLSKLIGGTLEETGTASGMATQLPIDTVDQVHFDGRRYCFTGKFVFGSRKKCEQAVESLGAIPISNITKQLDYLVIGTLASRDWLHTSHGRKIEKAIENKNKGSSLLIVAEEDWAGAVRGMFPGK